MEEVILEGRNGFENAQEDLSLTSNRPLSRTQLVIMCAFLISIACGMCGYAIGRWDAGPDYFQKGVAATEAKIEKAITTHGTVVTSQGKYISVWHRITEIPPEGQ